MFDLCVIGGGINGCGIARDAAGRGLNVVLCEQNDLASGTSSASSKLIHGGLRYLEHYEFKLVRESLKEREILLAAAPHLIKPIEFILPHHPGLRPRWMLRLGLFIYDWLNARGALPRSRSIKLHNDKLRHGLKPNYQFGFAYSDCLADDARLVIANAQDARQRGANILTRSRCVAVDRRDHHWSITLDKNGVGQEVRATALVNATGPWLPRFITDCVNPAQIKATSDRIKLIQGSHIIVPKWFAHEYAYLLQNDDRRIVFVIPFQQRYVLIGTTERPFPGDVGDSCHSCDSCDSCDPGDAAISQFEIDYLCETVNDYFDHSLSAADVVSAYAGVRPLYDDGSAKAQEITRDYKIKVDDINPRAPLITLYGGKLTTYRKLSESVVDALKPYLPALSGAAARVWTAASKLPGGDIPFKTMNAFFRNIKSRYKFLAPEIVKTYVDRYGANAAALLEHISSPADLGEHFGHQLYEAELRYLISHEWARTAEDILWRRTKLGLLFTEHEKENLANWLARNIQPDLEHGH